ncbi:MAG: hypothetical protein EA384_16845 [Spirochaetaceae bacterium]|nr:MAG: hypothetical protein EA384_16845 [Spirochaetaceae bacterium]
MRREGLGDLTPFGVQDHRTAVTRYTTTGQEFHGRPPGSVMTVAYEIDGVSFTALNRGPHFAPNPSVSFFVRCEREEEVDRLWEKLSPDAAHRSLSTLHRRCLRTGRRGDAHRRWSRGPQRAVATTQAARAVRVSDHLRVTQEHTIMAT